MKAQEHLTARWRGLLGEHPEGDAALAELVAAYRSEGRAYHNLAHISALLKLSAENAGELADRAAVDLAIFYHDAIYDPARADNELKSAALARERLTVLGISPSRIGWIGHAIEATKHSAVPSANDGDLDHLLDFDLSILAAAPSIYANYAAAIRREYAIYPDAVYCPGRAKVLRGFLDAPRIYRVPKLAEIWEAAARRNLAEELAKL